MVAGRPGMIAAKRRRIFSELHHHSCSPPVTVYRVRRIFRAAAV